MIMTGNLQMMIRRGRRAACAESESHKASKSEKGRWGGNPQEHWRRGRLTNFSEPTNQYKLLCETKLEPTTYNPQVLDALSPQPSIVSVLTHGLGPARGQNQGLADNLDDVLAPANALDQPGGVCVVNLRWVVKTQIYCFREPARFSGWEQRAVVWIPGGGSRHDRWAFWGEAPTVRFRYQWSGGQ